MFLTLIAAAMPPQHPASIRRTILRQPLRRGVKKTCQWHVFSRDLGSYTAVAATSPCTGEALGCVRTPHPYGEWSETICRGRRLCRPDRTIPQQPLRRFAPPPFAQTGEALDYHMAKALAFAVRADRVVRPYEFLTYPFAFTGTGRRGRRLLRRVNVSLRSPCGRGRTPLLQQKKPPVGGFFYRLWIMVSGGRMTTRALSATDSVRKALPPTTAFSPMVVSPPKMEAPE